MAVQSKYRIYYDACNIYKRSHAVKKLRDLWEYYSQTCKDCGPYHPATKEAHDEVYQRMFTYLMFIEGTYTVFEECDNMYTRARTTLSFKEKLIDNTKVGPIDYNRKEDEWPKKQETLFFRVNVFTTDEEDLYEQIEASFVSPLITLKQSYTYNF